MNERMDSLHRNANRLYASLAYYIKNGNLFFLDKEHWYIHSTKYRVSMLRYLQKVKEIKELVNSPFYEEALKKATDLLTHWEEHGNKIYKAKSMKITEYEPE